MTIKRMCLLAWLKTLLAKVVLVDEFCHRCGVEQPLVWWCEDQRLWTEITGCHENGILCPDCFNKLAKNRGLLIKWFPKIEVR